MRGIKKACVVLLLIMVALAGCGTFDDVVSDAFGAALGRQSEALLSGMMAGWTDAMMFQMTYIQVLLLGGYGTGLEQFNEGEGVVWEVVTTDAGERASFIAERALLRRNPDGTSWWYLAYRSEQDGEDVELEYEARLDSEYNALEIYFRDPETGRVRHHVFEQPGVVAEDDDDWDDFDYDDDHVYWGEDLGQYHQERVSVTVGAGTFDANLTVYEYTDEETGERVESRWWITDAVPGELVLYEWEGTVQGDLVRGELMQVRRDYQTRFGAY